MIKIYIKIDILMNKNIPYSPFNRTYRFMFLQNQQAHRRNKRQIKSHTKTNISLQVKNTEYWEEQSVASRGNLYHRCRTSMSR